MENQQTPVGESRPKALGILVGRFQVLHLGHCDMIWKALDRCSEVGIFIGSSQEARTEKNPLSYEQRAACIHAVFGDRVRTIPLPDIGVGNNSAWGDYVLCKVEEAFGRLPDLLVSGEEGRRITWFSGPRGKDIEILYVKKTIEISATEMRQFLLGDDRESWQQYTDPALWPMYPMLREAVLSARGHEETASL